MRIPRIILFLIGVHLCFSVTNPTLADWPGWRGPAGVGVSAEKGLPTRWSATENVRWKVPVPGAGVSTPVVSGDHVFLTASDERHNDRLHVCCYHRADGRQLWHTRLFGSAQPEGLFPAGGMAVPTPATDGRHLYVLFGTGDLACLDFDGRPVWIRSPAQDHGPFRNRWGMAASPLLVGDLLIALVDHWGPSYLLAVDTKTGATRWKTDRDASVNWSSPVAAVVNGKPQVIVTGTHEVRGYDAVTGSELWRVHGLEQECIPSPVVEGNMVYAVSGRKGVTLAIRLDDRRGDVTATNVVWKSRRGAPYVPSGLCLGGRYYLVDDEGFGTCLDATTGAEIWRERMGGRYQASLAAGDGKVYFTNLEGVVSVVQAGPEFRLLAKNAVGESLVASPALSRGDIFLRGERHLFCVGGEKK
jgi:outer membrane protein assembly factor BamB